jgi:hypothetical protein
VKDLALISGYGIQLTDVYRIFVDRGMRKDMHAVRLLTHLFCSIANPDALLMNCNITRHNRNYEFCQLLLMLDILGIKASTALIRQLFFPSRAVVYVITMTTFILLSLKAIVCMKCFDRSWMS